MMNVSARASRAVGCLLVSMVLVACGSEASTEPPGGELKGARIDDPGESTPGNDPSTAQGSVDGPGGVGSGTSPPVCPPGRWCSALYPPSWSASDPPDSAGRFLHDFSFAGYRYGEPLPTSVPGAIYDVVTGF